MEQTVPSMARICKGQVSRCLCSVALALTLLAVSSPTMATALDGFLLTFTVDQTGVRFTSAAATSSYSPQPHLPAADDWRLQLRGLSGSLLWQTRLTHPWHVSPLTSPGAQTVITVRVPKVPGATMAALCDQNGQEQAVVTLDASFAETAREAHQRFQARDRMNQARLRQRAAAKQAHRAVKPVEMIAPELWAELDRRTATDLELVRRHGTVAGVPGRSQAWRRTAAIHHQVDTMRRSGAMSKATITELDHTLSGTVRDAESGERLANVPIYLYQYSFQNSFLAELGAVFTSSAGEYTVSVGSGYVYMIIESPLDALYAEQRVMTSVLGDTSLDLELLKGVVLSGLVIDEEGNRLDSVQVRAEAPRFWIGDTSATDGYYQLVVPQDQAVTVWADSALPFLAPSPVELRLTESTEHDILQVRGLLLSGTVTATDGSLLNGATVVLRHLRHTSTDAATWSTQTDNDGRFELAVPRDLRPSSYLLSAAGEGLVRRSVSLTMEQDTSLEVTLAPGITVSGMSQDSYGNPVGKVMVRAYRDQTYITGAETAGDGAFSFDLEAGTYSFTATPLRTDQVTPLAATELNQVPVSGPTELTFTHSTAPAELTLRLAYTSSIAYELCRGVVRVEILKDRQPVLATYGSASEVVHDTGAGLYIKEMRLYLEVGTYDLKLYPLGSEPIIIPDVNALAGKQLVERNLPMPYFWTGDLRTSEGLVVPGVAILSYDDLTLRHVTHLSDDSGRFTVPMTPGGVISFYTPEHGRAIRRVELLGSEIADLNQDCTLDLLPEVTDSGEVLTQIWGVDDPEGRYNLVILGDGYTDVDESFEDVNQNQVWDGVLYYDLNGNQVWDGYAEPYVTYGEATPPIAGSDPTLANEPFTDLNGDGILSFDEQSVFDRNVDALVRSLLGSDLWQEHRDLFNIYRLRVTSEQAGHDILDHSYEPVLQRDTALNTFVHDAGETGFRLVADAGTVQQYINRYAPFANTQVVLVNQPLSIGRPNSYIMTRGGSKATLASSYILSHELGHKLGLLDDEYVELTETFAGAERDWVNVTTASEREQIPWHDMIADDRQLPSQALTPGVGLYEGAYYHPAGIYRPTEHCTMSGGERFCPVCRRQLTLRLAGFADQALGAVELKAPKGVAGSFCPVFVWEGPENASHYQLQLEGAGDSPLIYDVYASSLDLGCSLSQEILYRWRVRPGLGSSWGAWSEWASFLLPELDLDGVATGVASVSGLAGSDWHSDLWLHNAGDEAATVYLYYGAKGERPDPMSVHELVIAADATAGMSDVVATSFASNGSGAIWWQVKNGQPELILVEGRTYNRLSPQLRYGHGVSGRRWSRAAPSGAVHYLPVAPAGRYRTNLDFAGDQDCSRVRLVLRSSHGAVVAEQTMTVVRGSWNQIIDVVAAFGLDPSASHQAELIGLDGRIVAGNSMIDNLSNDASRMQAQTLSTAESEIWLPGAAYLSGAAGSRWRSDLTIINPGSTPQSCQLSFAPRSTTWQEQLQAELIVPATNISTVENVLAELFAAADGSAGSLVVRAGNQPLPAFMRTYSLVTDSPGEELSFGQYVAPWSRSEAIVAGTEGRIVGLNHDAGSRTNLLLQSIEPSAAATDQSIVTVELIAADGQVAASRRWSLASSEGIQVNGIVEKLMGPNAELDGFTIRVTSDRARVVAVASEVNGNQTPGTNDPRLIRARLLNE
jgi:hypothetical protein